MAFPPGNGIRYLHGNTNGRAYFSVMKDKLRRDLMFSAAIAAVVLAVYLPGLGNPLIFDDAYLVDHLKDAHRRFRLQVRMLSYGSFVWLRRSSARGGGSSASPTLRSTLPWSWPCGACIARSFATSPFRRPMDPPAGVPVEPYEKSPALGLAIGLFALNPVAVYAVAYLIQRSILLATLFVVAGPVAVRPRAGCGSPALHVLAAGSYVLALASKEYAILAPIAAIPLYVLIARPSGKRLARSPRRARFSSARPASRSCIDTARSWARPSTSTPTSTWPSSRSSTPTR